MLDDDSDVVELESLSEKMVQIPTTSFQHANSLTLNTVYSSIGII